MISTLSPHSIASTLNSGGAESTLSCFPYGVANPAPAVSVAVVNLYFDTPHLLQKLRPPRMQSRHLRPHGLQGFGYLIPASVPFEQNPERALGVIFDSDISPDLYSDIPLAKQGTRLTVMMGGHWWDGWNELPTQADCLDMAKAVLKRHLGIEEEPTASRVNLQRNCIPQYVVGHTQNMRKMHRALASLKLPSADPSSASMHDAAGRVRVAGSWYSGVGVNDCIRSAWEVVQGLKKDAEGKTWGVRTGLETFEEGGRPMAFCRRMPSRVLAVMKLDERAKGGRFPRLEQTARNEKEH